MSSILVTGAAGFIGSHLVDALLEAGYEVTGIDSLHSNYSSHRKLQNLSDALSHESFHFITGNLNNIDLSNIIANSEAIIHLAALPGLQRSWERVNDYIKNNISATNALLAAIEKSGCKPYFIQGSTSSVYGRHSTCSEKKAPRPISPYGITKLTAEQLVRAYALRIKFKYSILRFFSVYGPRQRPDMGYYKFIDAIHTGREITICGDGTQTRSSTYISDIVDGILRVLEVRPQNKTFNLGSPEPQRSVLDVISMVSYLMGNVPYASRHIPARRGEQKDAQADASKLLQATGWIPLTSFEQGLSSEIGWFRKNIWSGN